MANKSTDETGYCWQNKGITGSIRQDNSKTYGGEHKWYDPKSRFMGYHGDNVTPQEKKEAGDSFNAERQKHENEKRR